jgi:transcriptional regulator with XRE-family HTH domain
MRKSLAEALKEEIEARGQTQREAAAEIGTDPANLSRWLKGGDFADEAIPGLMSYLHADEEKLGGYLIQTRLRRHAREIADR